MRAALSDEGGGGVRDWGMSRRAERMLSRGGVVAPLAAIGLGEWSDCACSALASDEGGGDVKTAVVDEGGAE
jgi:hypothetical protein